LMPAEALVILLLHSPNQRHFDGAALTGCAVSGGSSGRKGSIRQ
jgi:hypothetical protein